MRVRGDNGCDKLVHVRRAKEPLERGDGRDCEEWPLIVVGRPCEMTYEMLLLLLVCVLQFGVVVVGGKDPFKGSRFPRLARPSCVGQSSLSSADLTVRSSEREKYRSMT